MPKSLSCRLLAGSPSASPEASSAASAPRSHSWRPALGASAVALGTDRCRETDPALECAFQNIASSWLQNAPSAGKQQISYSQPYPTPFILLITTQEVPFPPVKMVIISFGLRLDVFFKSPRALTWEHDSHFRGGKSSGSRLDETKVQIQGWALDWLCGPGQVA